MARGLGTALGLALTGLVYGLAPTPQGGYQVEMMLLAAVSAAAVALAAARRARPTSGRVSKSRTVRTGTGGG